MRYGRGSQINKKVLCWQRLFLKNESRLIESFNECREKPKDLEGFYRDNVSIRNQLKKAMWNEEKKRKKWDFKNFGLSKRMKTPLIKMKMENNWFIVFC